MKKKNIERVAAIRFAIGALDSMHGSVTGDPEFPHKIKASMCPCDYGVAIRRLRELISDIRKMDLVNRVSRSKVLA